MSKFISAMTLSTSLALVLMTPFHGSIAKSHEVEALLDDVGKDLEHSAVKLHSVGAGEKLLNAAGSELPGGRAALQLLESEIGRFKEKRKAVKDKADVVDAKLGKDGVKDHGARQHLKDIRKVLDDSDAKLDAIMDDSKKKVALVEAAVSRLENSSQREAKSSEQSFETLFDHLRSEYPKWKHDLTFIEDNYAHRIKALTSACEKVKHEECDPKIELDIEAATAQLEEYGKLIEKLEKEYGKEIAGEIEGFIGHNSTHLLSSVTLIGSHYKQTTRSLHEKLDWVHQGLDRIEDSCCK